ncbi:hypothetical protein ERO13_D13G057801v2 [Gossypium hirsutum]|nr:hypothetical protein ERO13_D13G057801v2 [Gossypium hirsutum]
MSASQTLGDPSRCGRVLGPSLDKIIKNAAWRKHSHIVSSCKSTLEKLDTLRHRFPALECTFKLFSLGIVRGEIDSNKSNPILYKIVASVCKVGGIDEEPVELAVLRVLLSAVQCPCVLIRGDCLLLVVKTCYNVYLGSLSGTIQACAKSVLAQIMLIVFTRAEEDSMDVSIKAVSVNELLEFTDKNLNEGSSLYNCQNFVSEVMNASERVPDLKLSQPITLSKGEQNEEVEEEEMKEGAESGSAVVSSKIREDGFHVVGPPSGSTTTLSAVQDIFLRHESVQCLVSIIKSMGAWMDQQLKIGDSDLPRSFESNTSSERPSISIVEDGVILLRLSNAGLARLNSKGLPKYIMIICPITIDFSTMTKSDFIQNNRGIDDGKDLPEECLGALYDQIVKNEIKMNADSSLPQNKQANSLNKLLGMDGLLNLVNWKQTEEKPLGANGLLIGHIQEQFKAKTGKSESAYHHISDVAILRFMVEVCWGPMLAAFSVTLDQSDDRLATTQCLQGFRYAVHVTAVMGMQTQRDAFVTSAAKFTFLHCAADMKQKNVDAVKAIISIAIEDGNHLQEAWEHILTCLSRIEHLQLLGEGAPVDAGVLSVSNSETDEKTSKPVGLQSLKKKGAIQNPAVMAVVRGGSYDSTTVRINSSGLVPPEKINQFIANLNLLDQIGNSELSHVFAHSQRLNSEAIVAFVKALCKVSMSELQSPTDPRVFSLTKLIEIAHYNMNRIRLVWSRMWHVLSDFFVSVGLSKNLSVASFMMDSLWHLAMKFLEREELANYNFQNEFLRPFVIIMQKSDYTEIRELIVRCISHMVLSHASNVKSGWRSVFMVFTAAADDEQKNKATTFMDCIKCLIKFTNSRINSDVSLNAIAFLRFCALKLAEGGLGCTGKSWDDGSSVSIIYKDGSDVRSLANIDDHGSCWVPLLTGLSKLTTDSRPAIRKSSLKVLFNILKDRGHLFSRTFWIGVFSYIVLPIFNDACKRTDMAVKDEQVSPTSKSPHPDGSTWDTEILEVTARCLVDLFICYYNLLRPQISNVVSILIGHLKSPTKGSASTAFAAIFRLTAELGSRFSEDEWRKFFLALKEAATSTLPELPDNSQYHDNIETSSDDGTKNDDLEDDNLQTVAHVVSRVKSHIAVQLLISQVIKDTNKKNLQFLSASNISIIVEIFSSIASHTQQLNTDITLQKKIRIACSIMELTDPPMVHFENEAYQNYLDFLQDLVQNNQSVSAEMNLESLLVAVCENILQLYLNRTDHHYEQQKSGPVTRWVLPLPLAEKEELAATRPLLVLALKALGDLGKDSLRKYIANLFLLLVGLVRIENNLGSGEAERVLTKHIPIRNLSG